VCVLWPNSQVVEIKMDAVYVPKSVEQGPP
jgi:hypothetical protein